MEERGERGAVARFIALGVRVEARSDDPEVRRALTRLFGGFGPCPPALPADVSYTIECEQGVWRLTRNGDVLRRERLAGSLLHWLLHDLNRSVIEGTTLVTMHAGGVALQSGAVLLPGRTESGKSTLTAGLVRAGFEYLSDEAVGIDRSSGLLVPYQRPLSLDTGAQELFPELRAVGIEGGFESQWQVPPRELGQVALGPCPVHLVIFPRYEAGASTTLAQVGRAEALVELARNTFRFDARPRESLDVLAAIVRKARCYRLVTGDLAPAVAAVVELTSARRAAAGKPAA